jgi:hypothetical protein
MIIYKILILLFYQTILLTYLNYRINLLQIMFKINFHFLSLVILDLLAYNLGGTYLGKLPLRR